MPSADCQAFRMQIGAKKNQIVNAKGMVLGTRLATTKNQPLHGESLGRNIPFQHYFCLGVAALPLILWLCLIKIGVPRGDHFPWAFVVFPSSQRQKPAMPHHERGLRLPRPLLACCHDTSWSVSRIIEIFNRKNFYPHGSPWWFIVGIWYNVVRREPKSYR